VGVSHHKVHDPVAAGRGVIEGQVWPRSRGLQVEEPSILEHRGDAPLLKDGPSLHLKSTVRAMGAPTCGAAEDVGGAESVQGLVGGAVTVGEELKLREREAKAVLQAEMVSAEERWRRSWREVGRAVSQELEPVHCRATKRRRAWSAWAGSERASAWWHTCSWRETSNRWRQD
jgi:hypothetical protein